MKLLVDTHAVLWFVGQDANLSTSARALLVDPANDLLLSAASMSSSISSLRDTSIVS